MYMYERVCVFYLSKSKYVQSMLEHISVIEMVLNYLSINLDIKFDLYRYTLILILKVIKKNDHKVGIFIIMKKVNSHCRVNMGIIYILVNNKMFKITTKLFDIRYIGIWSLYVYVRFLGNFIGS